MDVSSSLKYFPDAKGKVCNVELKLSQKQDGSLPYKSGAPNYVKRYVNNVVVLVPRGEDI